jgi:hypothetical protein
MGLVFWGEVIFWFFMVVFLGGDGYFLLGSGCIILRGGYFKRLNRIFLLMHFLIQEYYGNYFQIKKTAKLFLALLF